MVTPWSQFRGVWGPKVPTAGGAKGGLRQYVQLGGEEKVAAHRLGWVFTNPAGDFTLLTDPKVEASHLCFFSRCCNGLHLAMEPRPYNQSRSYCLCFWIDDSVDPPRKIDVCLHFPKCLRRGPLWEEIVAPWTAAATAAASAAQDRLSGELSLPIPSIEEGSSQDSTSLRLLVDRLPSQPTLPVQLPESGFAFERSDAPDLSSDAQEKGSSPSTHFEGSSVFGGLEDDGSDVEMTLRC